MKPNANLFARFSQQFSEHAADNLLLTGDGTNLLYSDVGYLDGSYKPFEALYDANQLSLRVFYALRYWADSPRPAIAAAELLDREEPFQSDEVLTREEALIAHTRSNAYLLFMEDKIGTLEGGKFADLIVLDRDYMTIPVNEIRDIKPVMTMVNGEIVFQASP